jgi:hypothetical protein
MQGRKKVKNTNITPSKTGMCMGFLPAILVVEN